MKRLTSQIHDLLRYRVQPGDIVIDATLGTGQDTQFAATLVGSEGRVFAFDIQEEAIEMASHRLQVASIDNVTMVRACHSEMSEHLPPQFHGRVSAVIFNLGYLPGGDHAVTTQSSTSVTAIQAGYRLLRSGGVLSVLGYIGHEGGAEEVRAVESAMDTLEARDWIQRDVEVAESTRPRVLFLTRS